MDQKRKEYRNANRDKINAQKRAWYAKHRTRISQERKEQRKRPEVKARVAVYKKNYKPTPEIKRRWTENARRRSRERKAKAVELLGGLCSVCGLKDDPAVYDFHHRNPAEKDVSISRAKSWAVMKKELAKCDLVCANCHRKLHLLI